MIRDFYAPYTEDDLWLIKETTWAKSLQNIREAQFALGNGFIGVRGVLEEIPYDASPGTYLAGIYDKITAQVTELVNFPNPFNFRFTAQGEKIGLGSMDAISHRRTLNTKKGILVRHSVFQDSKKRRYDYQSLRFISTADKNLGVMQIRLTALDSSCSVDVHTGIDTSVFNRGVLTEGRKRHFRVRELGQTKKAGFLIVDTFEKDHTVVYWSGFYYVQGKKKIFAKDNIFTLTLKKNQTVVFTKVFYLNHFPHAKSPLQYKEDSFRRFNKFFHAPFEKLTTRHISAWEALWEKCDILIHGTANIQQNLRFNLYHMLICGPIDKGFSSVGARTLSGEGYRGHVFWDAELFNLPFYLFNFPEIAKNMLLYRYKRLEPARQIAARGGFKGVRFPWESADRGIEETPSWAKDIDGTIIKIHTHEMEYHITANIAYALVQYYTATGDGEFMRQHGYELLFETARFWVSRLEYNSRKKHYEINNVIGPDEFHVGVNNNAYTNMMAQWNISAAYKFFCALKRESPHLCQKVEKKIGMKKGEVQEWKKVASKIYVPINKKKRVIEQFDGFFRLKNVPLVETDENGIPVIPLKARTKNLGKTQLVKQADVLMLLYVLSDKFNAKTKKANYDFYIPRTVHKSSLSPSINSIIACECGDLHRAYNLFNVALRTDISNLFGNTPDGIHAACLGGTWQAVVFGFAGVRIRNQALCINPHMPRSWGKMVFSLAWLGSLVRLELSNNEIKIKIDSKKKKRLEVGVFGRTYSIVTNKTHVFKRKETGHPVKDESYY